MAIFVLPANIKSEVQRIIMEQQKSYVRVQQSWLAAKERILLIAIARALPRRVQPDHLTLVGVVGSLMCGIGFAASGSSHLWLLLVFGGLFLNWFGDSLDGNLARVRRIERPTYGFFVDHTSDILSQVMIFIGMAVSSNVRFQTGCLLLMSYWLAAMFTFIRTISSRVFQISYYGIGPTEIRLGLMVYALSLLTLGPMPIDTGFGILSLMDIVAIGIFTAVMTSFFFMALMEARRLGSLEGRPVPAPHSASKVPSGFGLALTDKPAS